jgi:hypothetical protein
MFGSEIPTAQDGFPFERQSPRHDGIFSPATFYGFVDLRIAFQCRVLFVKLEKMEAEKRRIFGQTSANVNLANQMIDRTKIGRPKRKRSLFGHGGDDIETPAKFGASPPQNSSLVSDIPHHY